MKLRPLCRYCGKPIRKQTILVFFSPGSPPTQSPGGSWRQRSERLETREDAQRLFNETIQSVRYVTDSAGRYVCQITAWDGESYVDKHFCNDKCARRFGSLVASEKPELATKEYWDAIAQQKLRRKDQSK